MNLTTLNPTKIEINTDNILTTLKGIIILSLLAQIKIPLPWSPVPITGQTFGVALLALSLGRKHAFTIVSSYLLLGFLGAPIFAGFSSGASFGPTFGYLIGMLLSSIIIGHMSDNGAKSSFLKSLLATYIGSLITFSCGLFVLSFFIPTKALLIAGLVPFLAGDLIKNLLAAMIVSKNK